MLFRLDPSPPEIRNGRSFRRRATENLFARKTHEHRVAPFDRAIAGSEIDRSVDLSEWKICFPSRLSEIGGLSQLARNRTIRLYFQQDDSISSNLGKLGERWERRGKGTVPPSLGTEVDGVFRGKRGTVVTKLIRRL